jgi:hypothetical protein
MQLFTNSQISTPQCYYRVVMAFRGRKKKAACRFGTSSLFSPRSGEKSFGVAVRLMQNNHRHISSHFQVQ